MNSKKIKKDLLLAWLIVIGGSRLSELFSFIPVVSENLSLITAVLLLYVPIGFSLKYKERFLFIDSTLAQFFRSVLWFIGVSALVFIPGLVINHFYQKFFFGFLYHTKSWPDLLNFSFYEIVAVALPEEFFFRGFFLERMKIIYTRSYFNFFGVSIGPALLLTSLIFALSHSVITLAWWHIFIFFPAMLFGWLKEKTGTITAPLLFHAACNIFAQWVFVHYF